MHLTTNEIELLSENMLPVTSYICKVKIDSTKKTTNMTPDTIQYPIYTYSEIFSGYFFQGKTKGAGTCPDHVLVFVISGELTVRCQCGTTTIAKGEYIFLRKDTDTVLERKASVSEPFRSVFMGFNHTFLKKLYPEVAKKKTMLDSGDFADNVIPLPKKPYLESLYVSMLPYLQSDVSPIKQVLEIKLMEAVYSLILTDNRFYSCLFDFSHAEKIECEVQYTSYNASQMQSFYMTQEMDSSYIIKQDRGEVTDVYLDVTYRNVARFLNAFGQGLIFPPLN